MADKYGTENLEKIVVAAAEAMNVVGKLINKGGIFVLFQMADELSALGSMDRAMLKQEIGELSEEDQDKLKEAFKEKLDLANDELEKKIEDGADVLDDAIDVVCDAMDIVERSKKLFA